MGSQGWRQSASSRGKAAELRFTQLVLEMGWDAATPCVEDQPYDLLVHRGESWEKVQIKRSYLKEGHPTVNLVRHDGCRYDADDADWLAAVEVETGRVWFVPFGEVAQYQRKRITADMYEHELSRTGGADDDETDDPG